MRWFHISLRWSIYKDTTAEKRANELHLSGFNEFGRRSYQPLKTCNHGDKHGFFTLFNKETSDIKSALQSNASNFVISATSGVLGHAYFFLIRPASLQVQTSSRIDNMLKALFRPFILVGNIIRQCVRNWVSLRNWVLHDVIHQKDVIASLSSPTVAYYLIM